jgi:hypothetical protein
MPAWWLGSLSSARRIVLFKDISDQANTLVIVLNPMILVGLATVAAKRCSQKRQPVFLNLLDTGGGFKEVCWCRGLAKKSRRLRRP